MSDSPSEVFPASNEKMAPEDHVNKTFNSLGQQRGFVRLASSKQSPSGQKREGVPEPSTKELDAHYNPVCTGWGAVEIAAMQLR